MIKGAMSIYTENKNAGMIVAHPDDCVIYGWPIIKYCHRWQWKIVYLTHDEQHIRAQEIKKFWAEHNIRTEFCGYEDHHRDLDAGRLLTFDEQQAKDTVKHRCKGLDVIVTHGSNGDYGHIHHQLVHSAVQELDIPKIYFSDSIDDLYITSDMYGGVQPDLKKLPLHRKVIEMFNQRHIGKYSLSPQLRIN